MEDYDKYVDYNNVCRCCLIPADEMQEIPQEIRNEISSSTYQVKILFNNTSRLDIQDLDIGKRARGTFPLLQFYIETHKL